jgi:hypothetical protein
LVVVLFLVPFEARGQTIPSPYRFMENRQEASVFFGMANSGTGRFGYGPSSSPLFGGRYGIQVGGPFSLEGVIGYQPTTRDIIDPDRDEGDRAVGEADAQILSIDARLRFSLTGDRTWRGINPYAFFGIGVGWDLAGDSPSDGLLLPEDQWQYGTKFLAPFGGGLRWLLSERFLVRGDFTVMLYRLVSPRGFLDPNRGFTGVGEKEWVNAPTFSVGIGYHF